MVEITSLCLVGHLIALTVGAPADGALSLDTGAVERATTAIGCDVNKPVKSSLHFEKVKI